MTGRRSSVSLPIAHPKDDEHKFGAFVAANAAHAQTQTPRARPPTQAQNAETQTAIPPFSEAEQRDSSTAESPRKSAHVQTEALESSQAAHVQTQTLEARVFRRRSTSAPSVQFAQFQPKVLEPLQGDLVTSSSATDVIQSSKGPPQTSTPPSPRKENTTPRPELLTIPTQTSLPASPVGSRQISPRETPRACPRDVEAVPESERQEEYANPVALVGPGHADQKAAHSAETDHMGTQHREEHEFHGGDTTFGIIEEANRSPGCDRDKHATRMSVRRRYVNSRELLGPSRTKKKAQMAKKGHGRYRNSPRSPGSTTPNSESSPTVTPRLCRKDRDATPRSARKGYQNPKALKPDHKYKRSHAQTQTQRWRSSSSVDPSDDVAEELPTTPRYCPRDRDPVPKSARRISPAARGRAIRKPQPPPSGIFQGCLGGCGPEESRKPFDTNPKYPSPKFPKVESSVTQHPNYQRGLNQKQVISQVLQEKIIPPVKPPPPRPPAAPAAVVPIGTQTEALDPVPVAPKVVSSVGCCTVRPIGVATAVQVSSLPASCLPAGLKSTAARSKTRSPSPVHRKEPHTFYLKLKQITETSDVDGWHYKENNKDATLSTPRAENSPPSERPQIDINGPATSPSSLSKTKLRSPHASKPPTPRGDGYSNPPTPRPDILTSSPRQHVDLSAPIVDVHCQREKPRKSGGRQKFKKYGNRMRERGRRASKRIKAGGLVATLAIQQGGRRASALLQERGKGCFLNMGRCFAKRS